jgi:hypothetical protein
MEKKGQKSVSGKEDVLVYKTLLNIKCELLTLVSSLLFSPENNKSSYE